MQRFHAEGSSTASSSNDYHVLPPSEKQIRFAQQIEKGSNIALPVDALKDRQRISSWIDAHKKGVPSSRFSNYPS